MKRFISRVITRFIKSSFMYGEFNCKRLYESELTDHIKKDLGIY